MADSTGETIQQRAFRLLEAIRATTENSHQPVFVAELAPGLQMNEGEVRGAFRYLKGKRWIDTFNIDYTARINAAGHDVVAEVGRMTAADAKSSQPDESLIGSSEVKRDPTIEWDVFISHASEDKESFVRPLAKVRTDDDDAVSRFREPPIKSSGVVEAQTYFAHFLVSADGESDKSIKYATK